MRNKFLILLTCVVGIATFPSVGFCDCAKVESVDDVATWPQCYFNGETIAIKVAKEGPEYCAGSNLSDRNNAESCVAYCKPNIQECRGELVYEITQCKPGFHEYKAGTLRGRFLRCLDGEQWCKRPNIPRGEAYAPPVWGSGTGDSRERCVCPQHGGETFVWDDFQGKCIKDACTNKCQILESQNKAQLEPNGVCVGVGPNQNKVWDNKACDFVNRPVPPKPVPLKEEDNSEVLNLRRQMKAMESTFGSSVWKNADGQFNTARLASDSIAGVVLGTAGGLITSNIIKKNQVSGGFENIQCTIGGQVVAGWGDYFRVGMNVANKQRY